MSIENKNLDIRVKTMPNNLFSSKLFFIPSPSTIQEIKPRNKKSLSNLGLNNTKSPKILMSPKPSAFNDKYIEYEEVRNS